MVGGRGNGLRPLCLCGNQVDTCHEPWQTATAKRTSWRDAKMRCRAKTRSDCQRRSGAAPWVRAHDLHDDARDVGCVKGLAQRTDLVQHTPQRPDVTLVVIRLAVHHLVPPQPQRASTATRGEQQVRCRYARKLALGHASLTAAWRGKCGRVRGCTCVPLATTTTCGNRSSAG